MKSMTWRRRLVAAVLALVILVALSPLALSAVGKWLVVADPLEPVHVDPARAVVVFGGGVPFRAMEAAAIYRQGLAHEVWLTQGGIFIEDLTLQRLGIDRPPEHSYSRQVLERLGVPPEAIRVLDGHNLNTADEVRTVARASGSDRVILITSKYHTRRVKVLWRALSGARGKAMVRYSEDDPFDPARWWRNTADAMSVSRELFGLVNAWAGFPVKSERW